MLERFTELGLVDDEAFADAWVRSRHSSRGLARRALRHELTARGVDADVRDGALASVTDADEESAARDLVAGRLRSMTRLDRRTAHRRLVGLLARRGYSPGMASRVVSSMLDEVAGPGVEADEDVVL